MSLILMGLDAYCGNYRIGMGSYSGVHRNRRALLELAIAYCERMLTEQRALESSSSDSDDDRWLRETPSSSWEKVVTSLKSWRTPEEVLVGNHFATEINYANTKRADDDELAEVGLLGLKWFINHSDCEGYWSPGQCLDIQRLFRDLSNTKDKDGKKLVVEHLNGDDSKYWGLFEASIASNKPVVFC